MDITELKNLLTKWRFDACHDYTDKNDHIEWLGIFEDTLEDLKTLIPNDEWVITERTRNPDNDFLRVDITPSKIIFSNGNVIIPIKTGNPVRSKMKY